MLFKLATAILILVNLTPALAASPNINVGCDDPNYHRASINDKNMICCDGDHPLGAFVKKEPICKDKGGAFGPSYSDPGRIGTCWVNDKQKNVQQSKGGVDICKA